MLLTKIRKLFDMQKFLYSLVLSVCLLGSAGAQTKGKETVVIETTKGLIKLKLFDETPAHKENFLRLVAEHQYDSLLFHRVIADFMIQAGDPASKRAKPGDTLGSGDLGYTIKPEFNSSINHYKGRLAAARENDDINPTQSSSAIQFYIVVGKKRTREEMQKYEDLVNKQTYIKVAREFLKSDQGLYLKVQYNQQKERSQLDSADKTNKHIESLIKQRYQKIPEFHFTQQQVDQYMSVGGTPHLDGKYTVFGEVIEGMEIVEQIAMAKTDKRDRPIDDVRILRAFVEP